jgi:hypothetical protein
VPDAEAGTAPACESGGCVGDGCIPQLATFNDSARPTAIVSATGAIYVSDKVSRRIYRFDKQTKAWTAFTDSLGTVVVTDLALDATHLYWTAHAGVYRAPLEGSGGSTISGSVGGLRLMVADETVYWIHNAPETRACSLFSAPVDGGASPSSRAIGSDCADLAGDATHVYVLSRFGKEVWRVAKTPGAAPEPVGLPQDARSEALELDDTFVYVTRLDGYVARNEKEASQGWTQPFPALVAPYDIARDPLSATTTLFVTNNTAGGRIQRLQDNAVYDVAVDPVPPDGGILAEPSRIVADAEHVYWTSDKDPALRWAPRCP